MKYDAGRDAQVVLILRAVAELVEAGQKIVDLDRAEREMMRDVRVQAAAERHRKSVVGSRERVAVAAPNVRHAEQHLGEGREVSGVTIGHARTKQISRQRAVDAGARNVAAVVRAKIGYPAEPAVGAVGERSAAAVKIEAVNAGSAGMGADIGVSGKEIELGHILRGYGRAKK